MFDVKEAKKTNVLVSGANNSGKTLLSCSISSILSRYGNVIAFDNSGAWSEKSDLPNIIKVFPESELPPLVIDRSIIYDISLLLPSEQQFIIDTLLNTLWNWKILYDTQKVWHWIALEEAHLFAKSIRSRFSENILRIALCGRNQRVRALFITPDLALLDPSTIRSTNQRFYGKLLPEQNSRRKFSAYHGKDNTYVCEHLDTGSFLYYLNGSLKIVSIPEFKRTRAPQPLVIKQPNLLERLQNSLK